MGTLAWSKKTPIESRQMTTAKRHTPRPALSRPSTQIKARAWNPLVGLGGRHVGLPARSNTQASQIKKSPHQSDSSSYSRSGELGPSMWVRPCRHPCFKVIPSNADGILPNTTLNGVFIQKALPHHDPSLSVTIQHYPSRSMIVHHYPSNLKNFGDPALLRTAYPLDPSITRWSK